jgi:hypothetical protein
MRSSSKTPAAIVQRPADNMSKRPISGSDEGKPNGLLGRVAVAPSSNAKGLVAEGITR